MGIIFIGDRSVGKSTLALNLASPMSERVSVTNATASTKKQLELLANGIELLATKGIKAPETLHINVNLLAPITIKVKLIDTAGEINTISWQQAPENNESWQDFKMLAQESNGIVVFLPPYREIGNGITDPQKIQDHGIPTQVQWCKRFNRWVDFFLNYCPNVEHVVLCINKADLFLTEPKDLAAEAEKLAYSPNDPVDAWQKRHEYIIDKYFFPVRSEIADINRSRARCGRKGLVVRCFITSKDNRSLLELPWLYLAPHFVTY